MWKLNTNDDYYFNCYDFDCYCTALFSKKATRSLEFVSRSEWGAKPPKHIQPIGKAVPYVIIHHSASPGACYTKDKCTQAMQSMQRFHQNERGWDDIGYK